MKKCDFCGKEITDDKEFCDECEKMFTSDAVEFVVEEKAIKQDEADDAPDFKGSLDSHEDSDKYFKALFVSIVIGAVVVGGSYVAAKSEGFAYTVILLLGAYSMYLNYLLFYFMGKVLDRQKDQADRLNDIKILLKEILYKQKDK